MAGVSSLPRALSSLILFTAPCSNLIIRLFLSITCYLAYSNQECMLSSIHYSKFRMVRVSSTTRTFLRRISDTSFGPSSPLIHLYLCTFPPTMTINPRFIQKQNGETLHSLLYQLSQVFVSPFNYTRLFIHVL